MSSLLLWLAYRLAGGDDYVAAIQPTYPAIAAITAVAFFGMGSSYWGVHYVFGLLFLAMIVPAALLPAWTPLCIAILALCSCIAIARSSRHFSPSEKNFSGRA